MADRGSLEDRLRPTCAQLVRWTAEERRTDVHVGREDVESHRPAPRQIDTFPHTPQLDAA